MNLNKKKEITLESVKVKENHVGSDWYYEAYINKERIRLNQLKTIIPINGLYEILLKVWEKDKIDDFTQKVYFVKEAELISNIEYKEFLVEVKENRGRFTGNIAKIVFKFKFKSIIPSYIYS